MIRPRRTWLSNTVIGLPGGNEDNDLWAFIDRHEDGSSLVRSTWVPDADQRAEIAAGGNIELIIWCHPDEHPPVCLDVVQYTLGAPPREDT